MENRHCLHSDLVCNILVSCSAGLCASHHSARNLALHYLLMSILSEKESNVQIKTLPFALNVINTKRMQLLNTFILDFRHCHLPV